MVYAKRSCLLVENTNLAGPRPECIHLVCVRQEPAKGHVTGVAQGAGSQHVAVEGWARNV